jgi:serine/threonine protein kinase
MNPLASVGAWASSERVMNDPNGASQDPPRVLAATFIADAQPEQVGNVVGPYKLLQRIGEGGFGVVYMAEQEKPVRRLVALKIIKPGMDTGQVIARFESERQALALMDHPNIAKVLDAGATDSGHPYFIMELVKGVPITEFATRNTRRLTSGSSCLSMCAMRFSTRTTKESFTATSNRRTSWSRCTTACRW